MKQKILETTTDRKTSKVATFYSGHAKRGTCPRCGSGRLQGGRKV